MRDYYPSIILHGNDSKLLEIFCRSIRFSTHCNYTVVSKNEPIRTDDYEYIEWVSSNDIQLSKAIHADAVIRLDDSEIEFSESCDTLNSEITGHEKDECARGVQGVLNGLVDANRFDSLLEYVGALCGRQVLLDILVDFEGDVNVIGGIRIESVKGGDHYVLDPRYLASLDIFRELEDKISVKKNTLLSLTISKCKLNNLSVQCDINKFFDHWEYYRAVGINVPLIIIQNLLRRKIKTYKFVSCSNIVCRKGGSSPGFDLDYDTVYFDLDETLVWNWKPITEMINFLYKQRKEGITINLITRHTYNIIDTLDKIGLNCELFNQIIVVEPHELKSSYISGNSILIDNEFPQRLDVRLKSGVPVLDLDQVDFFD